MVKCSNTKHQIWNNQSDQNFTFPPPHLLFLYSFPKLHLSRPHAFPPSLAWTSQQMSSQDLTSFNETLRNQIWDLRDLLANLSTRNYELKEKNQRCANSEPWLASQDGPLQDIGGRVAEGKKEHQRHGATKGREAPTTRIQKQNTEKCQ